MLRFFYAPILGIIAAFWVFTDSRERGYPLKDIFLWTLGALLLPIFVAPLYFIWRKPIQRPREGTGAKGTIIDITHEARVYCRHCGRPLNPGWVACPYCGDKGSSP